MPVSEARRAEIRELSNDERVDHLDTSAFTDADWARLDAELDDETRAFCRSITDREELHVFATTWNWDKGVGALQDILDNPACEAATALHIYWHARPEWYRQYADRDAVPAQEREMFEFIQALEKRYVAGAFPLGVLSFDPAQPDGPGYGPEWSLVGNYDDLSAKFVRVLPEIMYRPVKAIEQGNH